MSVQNLRKTYIDKGKLSVSHDVQGKPYIDLSECLRVFPERFNPDQRQPVAGNPVASGSHELLQKLDSLNNEVQHLQERLRIETQRRGKAEENEGWLRDQVDKLTEQNTKLLDAPRARKSGWFGWLGR